MLQYKIYQLYKIGDYSNKKHSINIFIFEGLLQQQIKVNGKLRMCEEIASSAKYPHFKRFETSNITCVQMGDINIILYTNNSIYELRQIKI